MKETSSEKFQHARRGKRLLAAGLGLGSLTALSLCRAADAPDAQATIQALVTHEANASEHRGHYTYVSEERSERTGGHLWLERVAETNWGKIKYLKSEDGQALTGDRLAAEKKRIEDEAADPEAFKRSEAARVDEEQHAKQMLTLLPKAFLFDPPQPAGEDWRIGFHPNPGYTPQNMEERALHGMTGSVLVDQKSVRMHGIDMSMPADVSFGFGLLATIKAGSNFETRRTHCEGDDWKTATLHTDFKGKALFLKTIARAQDAKHSGFQRIRDTMTVPEAVAMLEQP